MANSFTQLHIQLIFAVQFREALINPVWAGDLHAYLTGIIQKNKHKLLQVNSMPDHLHALIGLRPYQAISDLVQNVKAETSKWINKRKIHIRNFSWQEGYGAFSYSKNDVGNVIRYIQNQQVHHKKETFLEEYKRFLIENHVEFQEQYIFTDPI